MLTREDDVDAHALYRQGWTISAIARHLGHDRKTIRAYLSGERVAGERKKPPPDPDTELVWVYAGERLKEDPHLWAVTLYDEVIELGYTGGYSTFTRQLRHRALRPHCEACEGCKGRPSAVIEHPPGEETQWDWVELPDPPAAWGWGTSAHLLVGALAHSGRWRGVLAPAEDQPYLIDGLDTVARALGGLTRVWRFDRMATVCYPATGKITPSFAAVAKHYGVRAVTCPPRRGNRKGVVEKANHTAAQRWWRTLPDHLTPSQAQASLDRWCQIRGDARIRRGGPDGKANILTMVAAERLAPLPAAPFPATLSDTRTVTAQALVSWRGNHYSVPPELARTTVGVTYRLGARHLDITTTDGLIIATHTRTADGTGATIRDHAHVAALNAAALRAFTTATPHRRKERIPPGAAALAAAEKLRTTTPDPAPIDLTRYATAAHGRNTLT